MMRLYRGAACWVGGGVLAVWLAAASTAPVRVLSVSPSCPVVPENLLRLSVRFDAPPTGRVLARLALVGRDGRPLPEPFLEQELWSPDGLMLTVLLHPGRVKTGLVARQAWGPILTQGDEVELTFDGQPLRRWSVGPRDEQGPHPAAWTLSAVCGGRDEPLLVRLDAPIDALNAGYLAVVDEEHHRVAGRAMLLDGETTWRFTPALPWRAGAYRLLVCGTLEDASGNRVNGRFETRADERPGPADVAIPFHVA